MQVPVPYPPSNDTLIARQSDGPDLEIVGRDLQAKQEVLLRVLKVMEDKDIPDDISLNCLFEKAEVEPQSYQQALKNVAEECRADDLKAKLRKVGSAFLNNREISAQEAVYRLMPMPLKKASRKVVFVNSAPKDKWVSMLRPKRLLQEMDDNDENIFCTSPLDRYASRPNELENMCMAEFVQTLANTYTNTGKDATDEATDHIPDVLDGSDVNEAGEQEDEDAEAKSRSPSHTTLQNGLITASNFMPVFQQSLGKH
ncbi:hypothetical protein Pmani_001792 [Petrolisthes manimaculis]|uniref:Uncharacterized protein n=1 Tax=Petrolisthes manimaculis TaxID=1843537 RepID=A0AAE1QJD3_9EUCA|nr:hypothetical protein Pmani_001792 [Petrolisthes manimaculis]